MRSKWHLIISVFKSKIRILACLIAIGYNSWIPLAVGFGIAEILGLAEEFGDKR